MSGGYTAQRLAEALAGGLDTVRGTLLDQQRQKAERDRQEEIDAMRRREHVARLIRSGAVREEDLPTMDAGPDLPANSIFRGESVGLAREGKAGAALANVLAKQQDGDGYTGSSPRTMGEGSMQSLGFPTPPATGMGDALFREIQQRRSNATPTTEKVSVFDLSEQGGAGAHLWRALHGSKVPDRDGYAQIDDSEWYMPTPEAIAERSATTRGRQISEFVSQLREAYPHLTEAQARYHATAAIDEHTIPAGVLTPPESPTIKRGGREFPDTPEGHRSALEWERSLSAAGRDPNARRGETDPQGRTRGERNDLRRTALSRIGNMLAAGAPANQVAEAMGAYPELRGTWTVDDVHEEARKQAEASRSGSRGTIRDRAREIRGTGTGGAVSAPAAVPIASSLRADIDAAISEGDTPEGVLRGLQSAGAPASVIQQAEAYLRSRR